MSTKIDEGQTIVIGDSFRNRQPEGMMDGRWMEQHHVRAGTHSDSIDTCSIVFNL